MMYLIIHSIFIVAFVASQLGHSLPMMMMKRYARWINNEKDLIEMSKLDLGD